MSFIFFQELPEHMYDYVETMWCTRVSYFIHRFPYVIYKHIFQIFSKQISDNVDTLWSTPVSYSID